MTKRSSCAAEQRSNPLSFAMQVNKSCPLFANEQLSLDFSVAIECTDVVHSLHSGDEEFNPGTDYASRLA